MYTTDSTNTQTCWRCKKCGFTTPLGESTCSNPRCRTDLSIYGEPLIPTAQQEPMRGEKPEEEVPLHHDGKNQSSSNLWEEEPSRKELKKNVKTDRKQSRKVSREEKKIIRKQQAEVRAQETAAQRSIYNRGPVKTFFLSVLVVFISLTIGIIFGYIPVLWDYSLIDYYYMFPWHTVVPGMALVVLSVLFARFSLRNKEDRKPMYLTIGLWLIPLVVSSWRKFSINGGDSSEMYSVYLFLLFIAEPVLVGSTFSGVKGLKRASSILRWIGILLLVVSGILAVILTINTYFVHLL